MHWNDDDSTTKTLELDFGATAKVSFARGGHEGGWVRVYFPHSSYKWSLFNYNTISTNEYNRNKPERRFFVTEVINACMYSGDRLIISLCCWASDLFLWAAK